MNKTFLLALVLAPGLASAQGMNQDYMQNMQKAQDCMAEVDQSAIQSFECCYSWGP